MLNRNVPSLEWTLRLPEVDPTNHVAHILRRGSRSFCGAVSLHRFGWCVTLDGARDEAAWEAVQTRAPNALCVVCLQRVHLLATRAPGPLQSPF